MRSTAARTTARVVGVIAILVGALWVGQGLGYLPGSFMTGNRFWFWVGAACVLAGLALLFASRRREVGPRA
jgi:LPXTG-motif cell wall-anchored protein